MSYEQQREQLMHKTFQMMFRILLIFGIPAVIAYFVGRWIDIRYDMRPYGTLAVLGVAFIISWVVTIKMYLKIDRAFRELREKEEAEEEESTRQKQEEEKI